MTEQNADAHQLYSDNVLRQAINPLYLGPLDDADGIAKVTGSCGDTLEMWLKVDNESIIVMAAFDTDGCAATHACGSMVSELVEGKSLLDAQQINRDDIIGALGGLPEENHHCAELAAMTLKAAIKDCRTTMREPWKKTYRQG